MQMNVMLVDDHPLFMEGLKYLLETHGIIVKGTAKDGREALVKARILKPDIILMDIMMPQCGGLDALRLIKAEMPDIRIVMLTASEEDEDLFEAVKYGASGYLLKNTDAKNLVGMLSDLENDEVPLSPGIAAKILREFRRNSANYDRFSQHESENAEKKSLTERQLEVLEMVAKGITYKEAGEALRITERTVKYHMGRILELLHLENRNQVIAYAARIGLVEDKKINT
ncbi:LuxR family two component transcriptional regulator [Anaerobacterium chartisolvens]|uniref:Stage 0 sporulation protein A homolog n=1 Tax=Anaerobacterium chartisolvens TaxID=1297424 RepID=A0A369BCR1_9FIRM|nr:response regulator transcription factor [Anaerobacterium chartisolvens]RCX19342.1 LuxR family two component transcriptional regulator [Anaerobacterium chartisolvens]